jgi:transposase
MAKLQKTVVEKAIKAFRKRKVMTIAEIADLMECSPFTVRNWLKKWNVHTSFNENGRYYVLPDVAEHRGIGFSSHGNLSQTVAHFIHESDAGLEPPEITKLLKLESESFLSILRKHPSLKREKYEGRYVYFSADEQVYARQRDQRLKRIRDSKMPSEMEAVLILAEMIKHPDWNINRIAARLKKRKYPITPRMIENLLDAHDLGVQKKGPTFP